MNLSPIILNDGSLIAWTRWNIWYVNKTTTTTNATTNNNTTNGDGWRNPYNWINLGQAPDFKNGASWEGEDPSLWQDSKGRYHILSHNGKRGYGGNNTINPESGDCGRHYFSATGMPGTWEMAPVSLPLGGCAYPRIHIPIRATTTANNDDDGNIKYYDFYRRERPHIIFGPDPLNNYSSITKPMALSTAVIDSPIGPGMDHFQHPQRDASYTLIQPIL